jgi:hypothetical protein
MKRRPPDDQTPIARPATPHAPRVGRLRVVLNSDLVAGATTSVSLLVFDPVTERWLDSGEDIDDVREIILDDGDKFLAGTLGWIEWYFTTWVFDTTACDPHDRTLGGPIPPPSAPSGGDGTLLGHGGEGVLLALVGESGGGDANSFYESYLIPK